MKHVLKIWPEHFHPVMLGQKRVELRKDDRNYQVGDELDLHCWNPKTKQYTGSWITVEVTHIDRGQPWLSEGYVALSIRR